MIHEPHDPTIPQPVPAGPPAILLSGVSRSFGDVRALDHVDVEIPVGTTVALLGPNGAGKSTAIGIMLGLLAPDAGSASTLGGPPRDAVAQGRVGALLQTGTLPPGATVEELIGLGRSMYPRPMALADVIERAGLASVLGRKLDGLSGGEAQRVRFGFAIAGDPELLFLDEPTVGMDVEARREFWSTMHAFAQDGRTILFATHYLDEADQAADRVVIIAAGRVRANDTPAALKEAAGRRVIRCRIPGTSVDAIRSLPGVQSAEQEHDRFVIRSADPDATLRALLLTQPTACDIEVQPTRLDDAFIALTHGVSHATDGLAVAA